MQITAFKNKNVTILSICLGLLFFGFNAAEQYFTAFYQQIGQADLAFQSLAILYLAIIIGNYLGPTIVRKLGIKLSIYLGFLSYTVLVFGIVTKISLLVYLLSTLLGIGAGILGIARIEFLRLVAPRQNRGEFSGAIESIRTLGGFIGIVGVSFLVKIIDISIVFILLGLVMLIATTLTFLLDNLESRLKTITSEVQNFKLMRQLLFDPKILLLLPYTISGGFLLGLVLGLIPATIEKNFGIVWVGIITSIFHLTLALVLLGAGYLSDIKGRFGLIYGSMIVSIAGVLIFLQFSSLIPLISAMVLLGLGGSLAGGAFSALMLDTFEEKIKEAAAVLGNLSIILGIAPSFLLPRILPQNQLFVLAIGVTILGLVGILVFHLKYATIRIPNTTIKG